MIELAVKLDLETGSLEEKALLYDGIHQTPTIAEINVARGGCTSIRRQCAQLPLLHDLVRVPLALPSHSDGEIRKNMRILNDLG